jgi:hypothetical protein
VLPGSPRFKCSKPLHLNRRLRYHFLRDERRCDYVAILSQWQSASAGEDWALALARER